MDAFKKDNYQLLIENLDAFIRKYYLNKVIRGALYFVGFSVLLFLAFNLLEYRFYFGTGVRKVMFFTFLGVCLGSLGYWVLRPMLQYFHLGSIISHEQAAGIIGRHFTNVQDKLLNILQLRQQSFNAVQKELIVASIQQKSEEIRPVPFTGAIDLRLNRRYLRYALPPLLLLLAILLAAPGLISDSTLRIIQNDREFERAAPFRFVVLNNKLEALQNEDFTVQLVLEGQTLANDVSIQVFGYQYLMNKVSADTFTYTFRNVHKDTPFNFYAAGFQSRSFTLELLKKPVINGFQVSLKYPEYTGRKNETLHNIGDLSIPAGTRVDWSFQAGQTSGIELRLEGNERLLPAERKGSDLFGFSHRALQSGRYTLYLSNEAVQRADSFSYGIHVIPDLYPGISAEQFADSNSTENLLYFAGEASDDYGIRSIHFYYRVQKSDGRQGEPIAIAVQSKAGKQTDFSYVWDMAPLNLEPGDRLSYYFEVRDNDAVNGSKAARTQIFYLAKPTVEEYKAMAEKNSEDIKETLSKAMKESRKVQEEIRALREKLLQQKDMDWQRKKELEKLLERQKELEKAIEEAKKKFEENKKNEKEYLPEDAAKEEKQEKLDQLFEKLADPETQELMDKIQQLMQELKKEDALQMMDKMNNEQKEKEMEMDRLLELFKTLEMEYELKQQADALEKLAEKQEELARETEKAGAEKSEELQKKQEEINKAFEELQKKMEQLGEKNKELERPKDLKNAEEGMKDTEPDLEKSKQQLDQKENNKASQSQKKAAKKMKETAKNMNEMMQSGEMQQMEEDMAALRQLLENIVTLSFDQEDLINQFAMVNSTSPSYVKLVQEQNRIKDNFTIVQDSLQALSKRVFQLESFITEKINDINVNFKGSLQKLEERKKTEASENQQHSMKNLNDLALMLSETMQQMQNSMSQMMPGNQMCSKPGQNPGSKSKPMDKITEGQKSVSEEMKKMKEGRDKGGQNPKEGGESKEFAEIAARQAALRRAMEEMQKERQQQGKGDPKLQEIIDQMNQNEIDLVNKKLTNEMIRRQQDIITRLLDAEKASREQDWDNKRKAERPEIAERKLPPSMQEYIRKRQAETEMFKTVAPSLRPYYKERVEEYYRTLKSK